MNDNSRVSIHSSGQNYFGALAFNREAASGAMFNPSGNAFQINNGENDKNLHFQVYNGAGNQVTNEALVISGTNGYIGIGTSSPQEQLSVNGKIRAKEIKVEAANWPDYVFTKEYTLPPLAKVEIYPDQQILARNT